MELKGRVPPVEPPRHVRADEPGGRYPADAEPRAALHRKAPGVHRISGVEEERSPPAGQEELVQLDAAGQEIASADHMPQLVARTEAVVAVAADAVRASREEAQAGRQPAEVPRARGAGLEAEDAARAGAEGVDQLRV